MKLVRTENAVGCVLCHDITQIIKGVTKDAVFRKGHIVRQEDIPVLLSVGKEHLYVWESDENTLHENDAAERLLTLCGQENMLRSEVKEGKIELKAACDGVFLVDSARLVAVNSQDEVMIATRKGGMAVREGDKLALAAADTMADYLGRALALIANVVDPEMFLIGGGVARAGDVLFDPLVEHFKTYAFKSCRETPIKAASLGNDAGIYGAVRLIVGE